MTKAHNAEVLNELSRTWRDTLAQSDLPPVAPEPEPEPPADPMPEDPVGGVEHRTTTTRVPRIKAQGK